MGNAYRQEGYLLRDAHKMILLQLIEVRLKVPSKYINNTKIRLFFALISQKMMDSKYIMMDQI